MVYVAPPQFTKQGPILARPSILSQTPRPAERPRSPVPQPRSLPQPRGRDLRSPSPAAFRFKLNPGNKV